MRRLNSLEHSAILKLSVNLEEAVRAQLLSDLQGALAVSVTKDGSRLHFFLKEYERPEYHGQHTYGCGGVMFDADGAELSVTLYADENNRLLELELVKLAETDIVAPNWETFRVLY
jgi:hypothetical protein